MRSLDIIVTHYQEPWEIAEKFFNMLDLQRAVDFSKIRVILIHDGSEAFPESYFEHRPYQVVQKCIEHSGIAEARNAGIREADAEWISFSDIDDMYYNICGLHSVMEVFPKAENKDMLVASFVEELVPEDASPVYAIVDTQDMVFIHAKYYRLDVIRQHDIWFDSTLPYNEDGLFNMLVYSWIGPERRGNIDMPVPAYLWTHRIGSMTRMRGKRWLMLFSKYLKDRKTTEAFKCRMTRSDYVDMASMTIVDAYYLTQFENPEEFERYDDLTHDIDVMYPKYRPLLDEVTSDSLRAIKKGCHELFCENCCFDYTNAALPGHAELKLRDDRPSFWNWIDQMDSKYRKEVNV